MPLPNYERNTSHAAKDAALGILFPDYYLAYRLSGCSLRNSSKFKITAANPDGTFELLLLSIAPEYGRVRIPCNITAAVTLHQLHLAYAYTVQPLPQQLPDNSQASHPNRKRALPLTKKEIAVAEKMRKLHADGVTQTEIGRRLGYSSSYVSYILNRQGKWRDS